MDAETSRELRQVRAIFMVAGTLAAVFALAAFRQSQKTRFTEIDVERINVVEKDGKLRLTMSNAARLPDLMLGGKEYALRGGTGAGSAGLIFFNDEGNENGGLAFGGHKTATGYRANGHLSFDQFDQDETVTYGYSDVDGHAYAGLTLSDRSTKPIKLIADTLLALMKLPNGPERNQRIAAIRNSPLGEMLRSSTRLYVGKKSDRSAVVELSDTAGRTRLVLKVDSLGTPSMDFLDEAGKTVRHYPDIR
jgi:hypothetical protein